MKTTIRSLKFLIIVLCCLAPLCFPDYSAAHAQLETSDPPSDQLLAAPPSRISLTFTEPVAADAIAVTAVDEQGRSIPLGVPRVDPQNERRVLVSSDGFTFGTFTISWSNRSDTDGHALSGSFTFRVGGSGGAPVAASLEGERPPTWGVITRWLTFLGLVSAVGLLLVASRPARNRLVLIGLTVSLLATVADPLLLSVWPPEGSQRGSLGNAINAQPDGWWVRLVGLLVAILLLPLISRGRRMRLMIGGTALVVIGGISMTSHAAGRETYPLAAIGVTFIHNAAVALWVGGLALVLVSPETSLVVSLRLFSKRALPLALIAIATGVVNALFLVPSVDALTQSDYGRIILLKSAVVIAILLLAALHRRLLIRSLETLPELFKRSIRLELAALALAIALAATLALLAPARESDGLLDVAEIGMPTSWVTTNDQVYIRLDVVPRNGTEMSLSAFATDGPPLTVEEDASGSLQRVIHPKLKTVQRMRVELTSLSHEIAPRELEMQSTGDGTFSLDTVNVGAEGWWRVVVTVRQELVATDAKAEFILRLPDPNFEGFDATASSDSNAEAEAYYERAMKAMRSVRWAVSHDGTSGSGGVDTGSQIYIDGAYDSFSPNVRLIRIDGTRYFQNRGGEWGVSTEESTPDSSTWMTDFEGATSFQLGNREVIDGIESQIIALYVSGDTLAAAYYLWWVDVDTGRLVKQAMVSRNHYMNRVYDWSSEPAPIEPPV